MRNEEGERFLEMAQLEMAQGLDLTIMNTYFKKPEEQKITYRSGTRSSQIDFLCMVRNEDRKQNLIRDCKVIPGEAVVAHVHRMFIVMDLIMNIFQQREKRLGKRNVLQRGNSRTKNKELCTQKRYE